MRYDLHGIIISVILACISDAYSYRRIHIFMKTHFIKLKKLLNLSWKNPPSYRGLHAIISGISATELEQEFRKYSTELYNHMPENSFVLACDGKALRGSFDNMQDKKMAQMLSVFAADDRIILAHHLIDDKSNEIPVFQQLVGEMGLTGKLFTLDAMHCQKKR